MSLELCEMSLKQTQDLLRLTDATLQEICCRRFTSEELYAEALSKVLGGEGRRGPKGIFIALRDETTGDLHGRLFQLKKQQMIERSEEISIEAFSAYAINLAEADVVISNWNDSCESVEEYQGHFHPDVAHFAGSPVTNFVCCRISGERPGSIIALNYPGQATEYDGDVLRGLAVVIGSLVTLSNEVKETEKAFIYTIEALARACEAAEEETGTHIVRVNRFAGALAANMGLSPDFVDMISYSAQMHDVGKIKVPVTILLKPGALDPEELRIIQMHPIYGEQILGDSPRLQFAREIAVSHHENWDGSGYPYGLHGEEIPLAGRIVKLADVYDALRSKRSYKSPLTHAEVLDIFRNGDARVAASGHFDPVVLSTFFNIEKIFASIYDSLITPR